MNTNWDKNDSQPKSAIQSGRMISGQTILVFDYDLETKILDYTIYEHGFCIEVGTKIGEQAKELWDRFPAV